MILILSKSKTYKKSRKRAKNVHMTYQTIEKEKFTQLRDLFFFEPLMSVELFKNPSFLQ